MSKLAAVFDNVTITVKWLLHPFQGNLTCTLNAGDGHNIDPYSPVGWVEVHIHPIPLKRSSTWINNLSLVGRRQQWCTGSTSRVCLQSAWSARQVTGASLQTRSSPCRSLLESLAHSAALAETRQQMAPNATRSAASLPLSRLWLREVSLPHTICFWNATNVRITAADSSVSGTNVSYTIHHGDRLVVNSSADRGLTPHNLTLNASVIGQLGPGCHNLTLSASNRVSAHPVSSGLELCLLEPVEGLQAWVEWAEDADCPDLTDLVIGVSFERGVQVKLLFTLTARGDALSENRDMFNGSVQTFTFSSPLEGANRLRLHSHQQRKSIIGDLILVWCEKGLFKVNVRAMNSISASDFDVDLKNILRACQNYSDLLPEEEANTVCTKVTFNKSILRAYFCNNNSFTKKFAVTPQTADMSVEESVHLKLTATPEMLFDNSHTVTLHVHGTDSLPSNRLIYEWKCRECNCTTVTTMLSSKKKKNCIY